MSAAIHPSGDHLAAAMTAYQETPYKYDPDGGVRSKKRWKKDVFYGHLAEQIAKAKMDKWGVQNRIVPDEEDDKVDIEVTAGDRTYNLDVKHRYLWDYPEPDLLVRKEVSDERIDAYILVEVAKDLERHSANVEFWATPQDVTEFGEPFEYGDHNKEMVRRQYLRPVGDLFLFFLELDSIRSQ